jgi:hypothetical protein
MARKELEITAEWSAPLTYTWQWYLRKFRNKLKDSMQHVFKTYSGGLFRSYRARRTGDNQVTFGSDSPYAAAQEFGANIPDRFPVNAAVLRWEGAGGAVFAMSAKAFRLKASPHLEPAVEAWLASDVDIEWKGEEKDRGGGF